MGHPAYSQYFNTGESDVIDSATLKSGAVLVCQTLLVDMQMFEIDDSLTSLVYWLPLRLSS